METSARARTDVCMCARSFQTFGILSLSLMSVMASTSLPPQPVLMGLPPGGFLPIPEHLLDMMLCPARIDAIFPVRTCLQHWLLLSPFLLSTGFWTCCVLREDTVYDKQPLGAHFNVPP